KNKSEIQDFCRSASTARIAFFSSAVEISFILSSSRDSIYKGQFDRPHAARLVNPLAPIITLSFSNRKPTPTGFAAVSGSVDFTRSERRTSVAFLSDGGGCYRR